MKKTGAIKISNAVEFFPHQITMPGTSTEDRLAAALDNLQAVLNKPHWKLPLILKGSETNDAIGKLKKIFELPKRAKTSPRVPIETVEEDPNQPPRVRQETNENEPSLYPRVPEQQNVDTQHLRRSKRIASLNQASSLWTPKQFAALAVIAMKRTNQRIINQMKAHQQTPNNELPVYLASAVFDKETQQWLEIRKLRNHQNPEI